MNKIKSFSPLPPNITVKPSKIHGLGIFADDDIVAGTKLGTTHFVNEEAKDGLVRTALGGFLNHSYSPNVDIIEGPKTWTLVATKAINKGEELTIDYTPWYDAAAMKELN